MGDVDNSNKTTHGDEDTARATDGLNIPSGDLVSSPKVAGGVCVPAQPNQCADYCSAVAG